MSGFIQETPRRALRFPITLDGGSGRCLSQRQSHHEPAAAVFGVLREQAPAVLLNDFAADIPPEAQASRGPASPPGRTG